MPTEYWYLYARLHEVKAHNIGIVKLHSRTVHHTALILKSGIVLAL
jgi:hypothetical protein